LTPEEFQQRLLATAEELALLYAGTPDDRVEASLACFAERTGKGLRQAYAHVPAAVVDSMIAGLVDRIRKRRRDGSCGGRGVRVPLPFCGDGDGYLQYLPIPPSRLLINVPSGCLSMSKTPLNFAV
jgi:hypothetical protein